MVVIPDVTPIKVYLIRSIKKLDNLIRDPSCIPIFTECQ